MKHFVIYVLSLVVLAASGLASAYEFSGNVALSSDYRFRGISQIDRSPAISGGFDISFDSGWYAGTWASNVGTWSNGAIEIDYYGGYSFDLADGVGADVGVLYYNYPKDGNSPDLDYVEVYGSIAFGSATLGFNYSPDYFAETDSFWYVYGGYEFAISDTFSIGAHIGYNAFADEDAFASFMGDDPAILGEDGYLDYNVSLNAALALVDLSLAVVATDLDEDQCFAGSDLCEESLVLTISKSL